MNKSMSAQSTSYGMGTVIMHKVHGKNAEDALHAAEAETARLESMLSRFIPGSDISRINASAGIQCEVVSGETYEVLSAAVEFSKCSQGCFDITIAPLMDLWRSAKDTLGPPAEAEIKQLLPLVDYTDLILDPRNKTAGLKNKGQSVDLGGIGKGYAAGQILQVFKKYGISSAFTNFGGNVVTMGAKPDGSPWRVGIQHPRDERSLIGAVSVADKAVVTSGDYQRYFTGSDGRRYHHILDPDTGCPAGSGLISVTVIADSSMIADALSTILFVAGMKRGLGLLKSFPGTEAVFIDTDLAVTLTQGLQDSFQAVEGIDINILD